MEIKFKDGKEIEFKKYGNIWLADSVIWEKTELHGSLDKLRELKAKIEQWFDDNAPDEISNRFKARLPLWKEIKRLPFKDQVAYREGRTAQIEDYFLGDENNDYPAYCNIGVSVNGWFYCYAYYSWICISAVRLCLEEK